MSSGGGRPVAGGSAADLSGVIGASYDTLWEGLLPVGRDPSTGGYRRLAYDAAELTCREWFVAAAAERGLDVETDRNGNLWAWWTGPWGGPDDDDVFVVGSHLDSVRDGGAFDGPLGVVSALAALDVLRAAGVVPRRPIAVAAFADEEGARFGVACAGSRLLTGTLDADRARALTDERGVTLAEAVRGAGLDPRRLGRDDERLVRIGAFVELHVEQGRALIDHSAPVGVASGIWPHGRYRLTFVGEANHAGTTLMEDRHDPVQAWARTAAASDAAARARAARATFGRLEVLPNATNAVPSEVRAWLDARAADEATLAALLREVRKTADEHAAETGTSVELTEESASPSVTFDAALGREVAAAVRGAGGAPLSVLPTAAGHDAGVLASAGVPAAMLFVRNPTGISHAPAEHAERDDCLAGVAALARTIERLAC